MPNLSYPTVIIEFILGGFLIVCIPILLLDIDVIEADVIIISLVISLSYATGIASNSISSILFRPIKLFTQVQSVRNNSYAIVHMSRWLVRDCNLNPRKVALIRLCNSRGLRWVIRSGAQKKYMNSAAYLINNSNGIVYSSGDRNTDSILYHFRIYRMCRICFIAIILWILAVYMSSDGFDSRSTFYVTSVILSLSLFYASYERARYAARASFRGLRSLYLNRS